MKMKPSNTAAEAVHRVIQGLELAGHQAVAHQMRALVDRLAAPEKQTRIEAAREIDGHCSIRTLGDLFIPFLSMNDWWALLEETRQRVGSEAPVGPVRLPNPPCAEADRLALDTGEAPSDCARALILAGGDGNEATRILLERAAASMAPPAPRLAVPCLTLRMPRGKAVQKPQDRSFVGGIPLLPAYLPLPRCDRCTEPLLFFLQVEMPPEHPWAGHIVLLFACTACTPTEGRIAPRVDFLLGTPREAVCILRVTTAEALPREDYRPFVAFRKLKLEPAAPDWRYSKTGGLPHWVMEPEFAPGPEGFLLFQIGPDLRFEAIPGAPAQSLRAGAGKTAECELPGRGHTYFFATAGGHELTCILQKE